jgi:hypothetical protein
MSLTQMSYTTHKVWCKIEGWGDVFKVIISPHEDISDLRDKIAQKLRGGWRFRNINPINLVLWKVCYF